MIKQRRHERFGSSKPNQDAKNAKKIRLLEERGIKKVRRIIEYSPILCILWIHVSFVPLKGIEGLRSMEINFVVLFGFVCLFELRAKNESCRLSMGNEMHDTVLITDSAFSHHTELGG